MLRITMLRRKSTRSAFVSLSTAGLQLVVFAWFATWAMGWMLIAARGFLGSVSFVAKFVLNRKWAFGATGESKRTQAVRYSLVAFSAVLMGTLLFALGAGHTDWNPNLLQALSMIIVWPFFTYPAMKAWVFDSSTTRDERDSNPEPIHCIRSASS